MMREIYGLGFINGTQKLGWFQLTLKTRSPMAYR